MFPNAEPTFRNGERVSRTQAAKIEMLDQLSEAELDEKHRKSVELGVKRASRALREAFDQMKNPSPEEPSSAPVDSESESATD